MLQEGHVKPRRLDVLLWLLVLAIGVAAVVGNLMYSQYDVSVRIAVLIVMAAVALTLAFLTAKGQLAWKFFKEARNELRRVVWPTRQETTHTTLLVVVIVAVMALILWGVDTLFALFVSSLVM
ncbi:MAG: preprotein translocase subunit SecE [Gammaproteobacteria bacterium]|nr:preprotein translocase subunit SecE [Gammaproteobacteria bacterium]